MYIPAGKPLTKNQETALFNKYIQKGDQRAKNQLIEANIGIALKFSLPYCRRNPEIAEDLKACSMLGLCEAVDHFRLDGGRRFGSYAMFWCRKRILEFVGQKIKHSNEVSLEELQVMYADDDDDDDSKISGKKCTSSLNQKYRNQLDL